MNRVAAEAGAAAATTAATGAAGAIATAAGTVVAAAAAVAAAAGVAGGAAAGEGEELRTLGRKVCPPRVFTMVGLEEERRWRGEFQTGNGDLI